MIRFQPKRLVTHDARMRPGLTPFCNGSTEAFLSATHLNKTSFYDRIYDKIGEHKNQSRRMRTGKLRTSRARVIVSYEKPLKTVSVCPRSVATPLKWCVNEIRANIQKNLSCALGISSEISV